MKEDGTHPDIPLKKKKKTLAQVFYSLLLFTRPVDTDQRVCVCMCVYVWVSTFTCVCGLVYRRGRV